MTKNMIERMRSARVIPGKISNVVSELVARQPDERVLAWVKGVEEDRLYLSVITLGEIRKGVEKLPDLNRKDRLRAWLFDELIPRFQDRIVPLEADDLLEWGRLAALFESWGKPRPVIDLLMAVTGLRRGLLIVTRNTDDFAGTGAATFNPWLT